MAQDSRPKSAYVVNPDVVTKDIYTVETAPIGTTNSHVVGLTVVALVHNEVEHGCINKNDVVDGEVLCLFDAKKTGTVSLAILVVLVAVT
jgi:hypothetical protein